MIDIHAHILPGLDDGPLNLKEAVNLVRESHADGITTMFATPHAFNGVYQCTPVEIIKKCSELSQELRKQNIPMNIRPGSEVHLTHDIIAKFDQGQLMTLNNLRTYVLLELPTMFIYEGVINVIRQFQERGVTTVIAHPERNETIRKHFSVISSMIQEGALMQVTAGSLTGAFGKKTLKMAERMLDKDTIALIGSDIHPFRKFTMRKALRKIILKAGRQRAEEIFKLNPEKILFFSKKEVTYAE